MCHLGMLSSESEALKLDGLCSGLAYPRDGPGAAPEAHDGDGNDCNVGQDCYADSSGVQGR